MAATVERCREVGDGLALAYEALAGPDHGLSPDQIERARDALREAMAAVHLASRTAPGGGS